MNLLSTVTGYVKQLFFYNIGIIMLFLIISLALCWFCNRRGWTRITEKGAKWFKVISMVVWAATGIVIGLIIGFQIAIAHVAVNLLDDVGPAMINEGMKKAIKPLGLSDINQEIDLQRARLVLGEIKNMKLIERSYGIKSSILNATFDKIRTPFILRAEELIDDYPPESKVVPAQLVSSIWSDVYSEIKRFARTLTFSKLFIGFVLLLVFSAVFVTVSSGLRAIIARTRSVCGKSGTAN